MTSEASNGRRKDVLIKKIVLAQLKVGNVSLHTHFGTGSRTGPTRVCHGPQKRAAQVTAVSLFQEVGRNKTFERKTDFNWMAALRRP